MSSPVTSWASTPLSRPYGPSAWNSGSGPGDEADSRTQAGLPGCVTDVTYLGATTSCVVALESGSTVKVERSDLPKSIKPGQTVRCLFPADALLTLEG